MAHDDLTMSQMRTLITGASSGIGKELAREFARNEHPLILVSDDAEELSSATEELKAQFPNIEILALPKDLSDPLGPQELSDELRSRSLPIHILVNNAGVAYRAPFVDVSLDCLLEIIHLNVEGTTRMMHLFLPEMVKRGYGHLLNVSSIAGFQPGPLLGVYSATKAYILSLSEALIEELKDTGVTVTCLCPGPVDTPLFEKANMLDTRAYAIAMEPEQVAKEAHDATMRGEHVVIPGVMNKVMTFSRRVMTLEMQAKLQKQFYESKEEE